MDRDIDSFLKGWPFQADAALQARMVRATDGRQVIQLRVDLGILQMEMVGRPDGTCPHGFPSALAWLRNEGKLRHTEEKPFLLTGEMCLEADREFAQYYHRRVCWLSLREFPRAIADADHSLELMDIVREYTPSADYALAHEKYRGYILFHRTQAEAGKFVDLNDPEGAIDAIHLGIERMRKFYEEFDVLQYMDDDGMVVQLRKMEEGLRSRHKIDATVREQLDRAIEEENYEVAARLRDTLNSRLGIEVPNRPSL